MRPDNDEPETFTPLLPDGTRTLLKVSRSDRLKIGKGGPWFAVVTDIVSGRHFEVEGTVCSLPRCYCDARILREVSERREDAATRRRVLEARLLSIQMQIEDAHQQCRNLEDYPAFRLLNGVEECTCDMMIEANRHIIGELEAEAETVKRNLASLSRPNSE